MPSRVYSLRSVHIGPTSRYTRSVKKLGRLPSTLWPMNWPIHATTNTPMASISSAFMPKVVAIHRFSSRLSTKQASRPSASLCESFQ